MSAKHERFLKADLVARVAMSRKLAVALVIDGIHHDPWKGQTDQPMLSQHLQELTGHDGPSPLDQERIFFDRLTEYAEAAYALGIAVGQLVSRDVFAPAKVGGR